MKIIIIGGSTTGLTLANLLGEDHEITIIEENEEIAKNLAEKTTSLVLNADGSDISILKEAGIDESDTIITTADDKTNLMVCQIAKSENVKKIISLVNEPKNEELFTKLGVTNLVSVVGTNVMAIKKMLYQYGDERIIAQLGEGELQIVEISVPENSKIIGKEVKIEDAKVAAIYRSGELLIPDDKSVFQVGDVLLLATKTKDLSEIHDYIVGT